MDLEINKEKNNIMVKRKKDSVKDVVVPNPGSDEALDLGCECPVLDNSHGYGYLGRKGLFAINGSCPIHGGKNETNSDK